jgi:hypothetical protein
MLEIGPNLAQVLIFGVVGLVMAIMVWAVLRK